MYNRIAGILSSVIVATTTIFVVRYLDSSFTEHSKLEKSGLDTAEELYQLCNSQDSVKRDGCFIYVRATLNTYSALADVYGNITGKCDTKNIRVDTLTDNFIQWVRIHPTQAAGVLSSSIIVKMMRDSSSCGTNQDY